MGRDELGGLVGGYGHPGMFPQGHFSGVPAGPSKLVAQFAPWPLSQVFEGKLVSQLWGIKLFGPDSETTTWKSSLSLSVTSQFLITWERCQPFPLASIKQFWTGALLGALAQLRRQSRAARVPLHKSARQKARQFSADLCFCRSRGCPGWPCPAPLLGLQWAKSHGWPRLAVLVETTSAALPQPRSPRRGVHRPAALQWNKLTWQEHSDSSKASRGERRYDSSVKDFQLE